jgi:signal transduction histidine kinase
VRDAVGDVSVRARDPQSRTAPAPRAASPARRRAEAHATMLLAAANRLATQTALVDVPSALCRAARDVTGATFAAVTRRVEGTRTFETVATDGSLPDGLGIVGDGPRDADDHPLLAAVLDSTTLDSIALTARTRASATSAERAAGSGDPESPRLQVDPIRVGDDVWGVLVLGVPADGDRTASDWRSLGEGLAAIGGSAIARAEVAAELERQRHRSSTLLELSSTLAEVQDASDIAFLTCDFVRRASDAPFAMLGRRSGDDDQFAIAATSGLSERQVELIGAALRRTDRPSLRALLLGGLAVREGEGAVGAGMGIGAAMGAPIVVDGRTIGFLAIGAPTGEAVRLEDWHELLTAFAAVTATALARAEAVAQLAAQRDRLASEVELRTRDLQTALDELRVASDAKTDFLANVSHELRTPLTAILGFAEILASGLDGRLSADQARDVGTIQASSRHLLELIDDLIDIASIESGRIQLTIRPVVAEDVIRDAAATIRPLAGEKGIALGVEAGPRDAAGGPIRVAADRGRLRGILLNLLSNAVKFTPSGGAVDVRLGVEPGLAPGVGENALISIRDSGQGIAVADQERIFEKFVRIAGPETPGTGLGLPISRELARLHGGDVTVDSTPGFGSTFTVRIPLVAG